MERRRNQEGTAAEGATVKRPYLSRRLSTKLLWLTMLSIMAAEILIFVPSVANFRYEWLRHKVQSAAVAGVAAEQGTPGDRPVLGPQQEANLLHTLDAKLVALNMGGASRLLARADELGTMDLQIDLAAQHPLGMIKGAFDTLLLGGDRTIRVFGPVGDGSMTAEVVISERPLRRAMLIYARNIFLLSLGVSLFAAILVFLAISLMLIRPMRRMTRSMIRFGQNPDDPDRIIAVTGRQDEIGVAEAELADMQRTLARTLREQRHLADLGLAVSKINHDLRNILASAQLVSDRLAGLSDPQAQRFAPMLIRSLDRALSYTQSVLAYGRAVESAPKRRKVRLHRLVEDVREELAMSPESGIAFVNAVAENLEIEADPDQFHRVLANLARNAIEALADDGRDAIVRRVSVKAERSPDGGVVIAVEDTGPGLPERARENLFKAFRGSVRAGGTGLGLAIAAEIVHAHGGEIKLAERPAPGARFEIRLPPRGIPPLRPVEDRAA